MITKENTALRLFLPKDLGHQMYSMEAVMEEISRKKIILVELKGNFEEDKKRFEFIRQEARRLKYTYDTTSVLHVHFPKESTYGQFVYLNDMMQEDKHKRYLVTDNEFYIFGENPPVK